jgi:putative transposase
VSPERRRRAVTLLQRRFGVSERRACQVASQPRAVQRYIPTVRADEDALTQAIVAHAAEYGRYGYRRVTALLNERGWSVGKDRVQRIWRREGLKVPKQQRPRGRLWLDDGSCVRLRAERANHVWSYDFVHHATHDGRTMRLLTLVDEFTREALAIKVARNLNSMDVIETLADVMLTHGIPEHIRSDNGPEMTGRSCATGCPASVPTRSTSSRAALGRTDSVNRSTANCAMNS